MTASSGNTLIYTILVTNEAVAVVITLINRVFLSTRRIGHCFPLAVCAMPLLFPIGLFFFDLMEYCGSVGIKEFSSAANTRERNIRLLIYTHITNAMRIKIFFNEEKLWILDMTIIAFVIFLLVAPLKA